MVVCLKFHGKKIVSDDNQTCLDWRLLCFLACLYESYTTDQTYKTGGPDEMVILDKFYKTLSSLGVNNISLY